MMQPETDTEFSYYFGTLDAQANDAFKVISHFRYIGVLVVPSLAGLSTDLDVASKADVFTLTSDTGLKAETTMAVNAAPPGPRAPV